MKQYLDQFKLSGLMRLKLEAFVFSIASKSIAGYCGGVWESRQVGKVWTLVIPASTDTVTIRKLLSGGEVTTDKATADLAFTMLINNWFWNQYANDLNQTSHGCFMKSHNALRNAAYKDGNPYDADALFDLTD